MNPFPTRMTEADRMDEWLRYFDALATDEARAQFLVMLKEKRDRQGSAMHAKLLNDLGQKFLTEKFKG